MTCQLFAQKVSKISDNITSTVYELEDYVRHPRMEEEDRQRGGNPAYRPGLEIICNIDDVEIRFFEEVVGRTPIEWDNLAAGAYRVRMERTGYEILDFWVQVLRDRRTVIYVELGQPKGTLKIDNLPEYSTVTLNRLPVEDAETVVTSGSRQLKVNAFGWEPLVTTLEIPAGGVLEWTYDGVPSTFKLSRPVCKPLVLPSGDRRGFAIDWSATASGNARVEIMAPDGKVIKEYDLDINDYRGVIYWRPTEDINVQLAEGEYTIRISGQGSDGTESSGESVLYIDDRFSREPRPLAHLLPGLMYAPGSSLLAPGIWQVATGVQYDIGSGNSDDYTSVPVNIGIRIAPGKRWELSGKFGMRARDPFDNTSLSFSLSGSWRITKNSGPFEANLNLLYIHEGYAADFAVIPAAIAGMGLPGLQFTVPMEYAIGDFSVVLSPAINLFFTGDDPTLWRLSSPARFAGSLAAGTYWENGRFLAGFSTTLRSPDVSGLFLDWTMWSGLEGRFDLPGEASYLAIWTGMRYLDVDPVVSIGVEFGVIR